MDPNKFDELYKSILTMKENNEAIEHDSLLQWLANHAKYDPVMQEHRAMTHQSNLHYYSAKFESRSSRFKQVIEFKRGMFDSVIETAKGALKTILIINGGATLAFITFLSRPEAKYPSIAILNGLLAFSLGVVMSAIAAATTYLAQHHYAEKRNNQGDLFRRLTITLVVSALLFFIEGILLAYIGFGA